MGNKYIFCKIETPCRGPKQQVTYESFSSFWMRIQAIGKDGIVGFLALPNVLYVIQLDVNNKPFCGFQQCLQGYDLGWLCKISHRCFIPLTFAKFGFHPQEPSVLFRARQGKCWSNLISIKKYQLDRIVIQKQTHMVLLQSYLQFTLMLNW